MSPSSGKCNGSFIDYLDTKNCRASGPATRFSKKRKLSLKSPKNNTFIAQKKIDFKAKENISSTPYDKKHNQTSTTKRKPLSPAKIKESDSTNVDNEKTEDNEKEKERQIDFGIDDKESADYLVDEKPKAERNLFYIGDEKPSDEVSQDMRVLCEDTFTDDDDDGGEELPKSPFVCSKTDNDSKDVNSDSLDNVDKDCATSVVKEGLNDESKMDLSNYPEEQCTESDKKLNILNSQHSSSQDGQTSNNNKQKKLKIGLNRRHCNGRGASSFLRQTPTSFDKNQNKITQMLDKFKHIPSSSSVNTLSSDTTEINVVLKEEGLLTPMRDSLETFYSSQTISASSKTKQVRTVIQWTRFCLN